VQIPILNGIYSDDVADFRTSYPKNLIPVPKQLGMSVGYLRPADGIVKMGEGPGKDRGGINWNGICYRVMGTKLVKINENGSYTELGDVGGTEQVSFAYSFDYLAIASDNKLFLYDGALAQNTDSDLGNVIDVIWIDGYFMTTDGTSIVVTELNSPFNVSPLKYGSSEINPDEIVGLQKLRNEVYAVNRYTIEVFDNVGGSLFPFQRIDGAHIERGAVGTHAFAVFVENIAFLGSKLNEPISVWIGGNGSTRKIATHEIDIILQQYTEDQLSKAVVETVTHRNHEFLIIHLPNRSLVYDGSASAKLNTQVWFTLTSSLSGYSAYKARNFVFAYDKWITADPNSTNYGYMDDSISSHYGEMIDWEFGTTILYNEGNGAIFNELELVALTGRVEFGEYPTIWTSYSDDGVTWSQERPISAGKNGNRTKRLAWFRNGIMRNWRVQKFRGTSDTFISMARLEAKIEPLAE
jgi:hypothetical protein